MAVVSSKTPGGSAGVKSFPRGKAKKVEVPKDDVGEDPDSHVKRPRPPRGDDDLFRVGVTSVKAAKAKKKAKNKKATDAADGESPFFRITQVEPLSYRQLNEGMVLLGCVASVGDYELKVSLPGHLVGSVPITGVSAPYTKALREIANGGSADVRPLKDMFAVGQVCLCAVEKVEVSEDHFYKVTLTLAPQAVQNIPPSALKKGFLLQAAVKSVEDHGFIVDVGVTGLRAFLPHKRAEKYVEQVLKGQAPTVGQLVPTLVTKVDCGSIGLTADPIKLRKAVLDPGECSIHTLLPGMCLRAKVLSAMKGGMKVKAGEFTAYVHRDHIAREVEEGESVLVRVLYVLPTVNTIHVSCKDHLKFAYVASTPGDALEVGQLVKDAEVIDCSKYGLVLKLKDSAIGSVSARQVTEQKEIPNLREKYPLGSKVSCRIIQYDHVDAMFICSMQKTILAQKVLKGDQLKIGDKVSCKVKNFVKAGVIVEIGRNIEGFVPLMHLSDVPLKNPEKKYPPGTKLSCRVLREDPKRRRRLHLTNKSILVKEEYPIVCTYDPSKVGVVTEGIVVFVSGSGLLLELFGDVKGWVPKSKISTETIEYPEKLFFVGQALKCEVVDMDPEKKLMTLSLIIGGTHKPLGSRERKSGDKVRLGSFYDCVVVEKDANGLTVEITVAEEKDAVRGFIPKQHLTDHVLLAHGLLATYSAGDKIEEALCFEKDVLPILTLKPIIIEAARSPETLPKSFEDLEQGVCVPGVVCMVKSYGVFLRLPTWKFRKSALVPMRYLADFFVENPSDLFSVGQTVIGQIVQRSDDDRKVTMSFKLKDLDLSSMDNAVSSLSSFLKDYARVKAHMRDKLVLYKPGLSVTCTVEKVSSLGLEVNVDGVRGLITNSGLVGLPSPPKVGNLISAVVLFVDLDHECLELSSNPELVKKSTLAGTKLPKPNTVVKASVVLVKSEFNFATLCIKSGEASGVFVHVPTRLHINDQAGFASSLAIGDGHNVSIQESAGKVAIGFLERQEAMAMSGKKRTRKNSLQEEVHSHHPQRISEDASSDTKGKKRMRLSSEASNSEVLLTSPLSTSEVKGDRSAIADPGWDEEFDPWVKRESSGQEKAAVEVSAALSTPKKLKTHVSKKEKKELSRLEAEEIARAEQRILDGETAEPETAEEFDRLVLSTPDSSLCWVKYMAFLIGRKEYEKARGVAGRALEKINLREDDERLNVYMAWLNLENSFGDEQSTDDLLAKALKFNDQYKVYAQAANIFDLSGNVEKAERLYKLMAKKYCKEPDVWIKLGTHYFVHKNLKEARFTLQRSIQNLDKKHHVEITSKFGQLEFKLGEAERGKTVFETILGNFPGRVDLWSVYVDMLVKVGEVETARSVLERMILLNLQPKKMKVFFKKYLEFEERQGNQQGVDHVRKKALDYVEAKVTVDKQPEAMDTE